MMRKGRLSERVRILYVESDEPMGLPRVRELASWPVQVINSDGLHNESLQRISTGEEARSMARRLDMFLVKA